MYRVIKINLSTARDNEPLEFMGDFLSVIHTTYVRNFAEISFDSPMNDKIRIQRRTAIKHRFKKLFITNIAQSGQTLTLLLSHQLAPLQIYSPNKDIQDFALSYEPFDSESITATVAGTTYQYGISATNRVITSMHFQPQSGSMEIGIGSLSNPFVVQALDVFSIENIRYFESITIYFRSPIVANNLLIIGITHKDFLDSVWG